MSEPKDRNADQPAGADAGIQGPEGSGLQDNLRAQLRTELEQELRRELSREIDREVQRRIEKRQMPASALYPLAPSLASSRLLTRPVVPGHTYERFDRSQRMQHLLLVISFTLLAITGFALLLPGDLVPDSAGNLRWLFEVRELSHRIAALFLVGTSIFHVVYFLVAEKGRHEFFCMLPHPIEDFKKFLHTVRFYLGLSPDLPRHGRFTFGEKFEYWALVWGTIVMTVTGMILWSASHWSRLVLDLSFVIHKYEAILAFLAVVFWHSYHVHLRPDVFPMSRVWWDGTITDEELQEEHILEWQALQEEYGKDIERHET